MFARRHAFRRVSLPLIITLLCPFTLALHTAIGAELRVAPSGAPYTSIQAAIDAASDYDSILIATGIYSDRHAHDAPDGYQGPGVINQVVTIDKKVSLFGGYNSTFTLRDPELYPTVIDAQNQSRCIVVDPSTDPVISGLIVRNGSAYTQGGAMWGNAGGGLFSMSSSPIILNCIFDSCFADGGGGLFLESSDYFNLLHTEITNNSSNDFGGGAHINGSDGYIEDCTFESNYCDGIGGGVYIAYNEPTIRQSSFVSNMAAGSGGGIALAYCSADLSGNLIMENSADYGAGIRCYSCTGTIERCQFQRNLAEWDAGGIYLDDCTLTMVNNFICLNGLIDEYGSAAGILIDSGSVTMIHNTVARNTGGVRCGINITDIMGPPAVVWITNQITASHETGVFVDDGSSLIMDTTHWHGNTTNWTGPGSIDPGSAAFFGDPQFVDPAGGDFHIQAGSPAVGNAAKTFITEDIDSQLRPWDGGSDIGADEQRETPLLGVWINMPQFVSPGDRFFIDGYLENSGSALSGIHVFFMLDVLGDYWFWPGWTHFDPQSGSGIDFTTMDVDAGQTRLYIMNPFNWPDTGSTALGNLAIWGAMLDPGTSNLIGEVGYVAWGFGP